MSATLAHSFSALELFDSCPKRFYHLKIAKDIKEDVAASDDGTRQHKALEDRLVNGTPLPTHMAKHEHKIEPIINSGFEVKAEQELAVTKELVPCDWWHPDVFLRVKADVALYGETTAGLLDWKTGKRRPKPFQLELGALSQFIHYPKVKLTKAAFLWLKDDDADTYTYTREKDYNRILDKLKTKTDRVEAAAQEDIWQAKPGYHCNWCGAKGFCASSQAKD